MLFIGAGLLFMQGCKKEDNTTFTTYKAAVPATPAPSKDAVIARTAGDQTIALTWEGTATNAVTWDLYFGTAEEPQTKKPVATGLTTNSYNVKVTAGGTYYWQVVTIDSRKVKSISPIWNFEVNSNPTTTLLSPANNATGVSVTSLLKWSQYKCDPEGDDLTYDVYFGTTKTPAVVKTALTDTTFAPTLSTLTKYYWKIVVKDPYGGTFTSPVDSFTTGNLPVVAFINSYNVAENSVQNGAYAYTCSFTKVDNSTIKCDNWWDSGWAAQFVLNYTKNTFVMTPFTFTSGANIYLATGSGKINQTTGEIILTYSVTKNGVLLENGVDDFTVSPKKSMHMTMKPKL